TYYAITGAIGGIHPRLEIRQLQQNPIMWNLFLLALRDFQAIDQNNIDSYYQIAGKIHLPDMLGKLADFVGYCPHHDLLFGTWHRPYILLFEQKLQAIAIGIANSFTDASYQDAANRLRLPFWDWARAVSQNEPVFPAVLSTPKVSVTLQDGSRVEIDNPLYDYSFHPLDNFQINSTNGPLCDTSQRTVRRATNATGTWISDHGAVDRDLRQQLSSLRQTIYSAITQYHSFNDFSNDANCGDSPISSIETPHNNIHNAMDPGHMSPPAVAAFDPLFWLHHSNVDRQIALFQALFPDTYVERCIASQTTWTIQRNTPLDAGSPLTPFHRTPGGEWWTSSISKNIVELGYTYPELIDSPNNETLISRINTLYRDSRLVTQDKESNMLPHDVEYIVQVTMPASENYSYNVLLFLDHVSEDPATWTSQDSFISKTSSVIAMSETRVFSTIGTIVLTNIVNSMIFDGYVRSKDIVDHLKTHLQWRLELVSTS
ncbi:Di-copper centre-containing protein, partial [Karstenula rhodostoma CBS 690.94]